MRSNFDIENWYFKKLDKDVYAYYPIAQYFSKAYIVNKAEKNRLMSFMLREIIFFSGINAAMIPFAVLMFDMISSSAFKLAVVTVWFLFVPLMLFRYKMGLRKILGKRTKQHIKGMNFIECMEETSKAYSFKEVLKSVVYALVLSCASIWLISYAFSSRNFWYLIFAIPLLAISVLALILSVFDVMQKVAAKRAN